MSTLTTLWGRAGETAVWIVALTDALDAAPNLTGAVLSFRAEKTGATDLAGTVVAYGPAPLGVVAITCIIPALQAVGTYRGWVHVNNTAWPTGSVSAIRVQIQDDE